MLQVLSRCCQVCAEIIVISRRLQKVHTRKCCTLLRNYRIGSLVRLGRGPLGSWACRGFPGLVVERHDQGGDDGDRLNGLGRGGSGALCVMP